MALAFENVTPEQWDQMRRELERFYGKYVEPEDADADV